VDVVSDAGFSIPAAVYADNMAGVLPFAHNAEWLVAESNTAVNAALDAGNRFFAYVATTQPHAPFFDSAFLNNFELTDTPKGNLTAAPVSGMPSRQSVLDRTVSVTNLRTRNILSGVVSSDDALGALMVS
jgi:hypothetical protein